MSWFTRQNISVTQDSVSAHPWDYEKWRGAEKKDAFTAYTFGSSQRSNIAGLKKSSTLSIWKPAVKGKHTTDKITFQLSLENMQFKEWCYPGDERDRARHRWETFMSYRFTRLGELMVKEQITVSVQVSVWLWCWYDSWCVRSNFSGAGFEFFICLFSRFTFCAVELKEAMEVIGICLWYFNSLLSAFPTINPREEGSGAETQGGDAEWASSKV